MPLRDVIRDTEAILSGTLVRSIDEFGGDSRWQAIMDVEDYVDSNPEEIWPFVARWGCHPDEDLRDAIAVCLLDRPLEEHFAMIFPRVEDLALTDTRFADTFLRVWKHGQAELPENSRTFDDLSDRCKSNRIP